MCPTAHFNSKYMNFKLFIYIFIFQSFLFTETEQQDDSKKINLADCGISKRLGPMNTRIVGGKKTDITKFPWTVSFQKRANDKADPEHFCGGTIINSKWLLSAGHCLKGVKRSLNKVKAVVGSTEWKGPNGISYEVDKLFIHENYDEFNYANDIALIKTKTPIKFKGDANSFKVNSICLPTPSIPLPTNASVYGWGLLGELSTTSADLMRAVLQKADLEKCNKAYKEFIGKLTKQMMCYSAVGQDACQGDSGGPLSHDIKGKEYQAGIISFGLGCSRPENPGIYTNVALYEDWIKKTIADN